MVLRDIFRRIVAVAILVSAPFLMAAYNPFNIATVSSVSGIVAGNWASYSSLYALGYNCGANCGGGTFTKVASCTVDGGSCVQSGDGSYWARNFSGMIPDCAMWGAYINGTNNDTAACQAGISWAKANKRTRFLLGNQGGGTILIDRILYRSGMTIGGDCIAATLGYNLSSFRQLTVSVSGSKTWGFFPDETDEGASPESPGLACMTINGPGAGHTTGGVFVEAINGHFEHLSINNFGQQGLCESAPGSPGGTTCGTVFSYTSNGNTFDDITTTNVLSNYYSASLSSYLGAVDLEANDEILKDSQNISVTTCGSAASTSGYLTALLINAGSTFISNVVAECADVAFVFGSNSYNDRSVNLRGDYGYSLGGLVQGSYDQFMNSALDFPCHGTTNTCAGLEVTNSYNKFSNFIEIISAGSLQYGIYDDSSGDNVYDCATLAGQRNTQTVIYLGSPTLGGGLTTCHGPPITLASGTSSLSVDTYQDYGDYKTNNSGATVLTISGGYAGMDVWVTTDANTTLGNSGCSGSAGNTQQLKNINGTWKCPVN